jgi:lipoate-protein ligase B
LTGVTELKECYAVWCGRVPYPAALDLQMRICRLKSRGIGRDVLLLLEHPPTITLGRNAKREHLLVSESFLQSRGIGIWNVDRGGDITFHGPGQLVGYPILSLGNGERDVHGYMRNLEQSLIDLLAGYGIQGGRESGLTGVWTGDGKIAAMGVHISRWVTRHGFALNVNTELSAYDLIVPCGLVGKSVTSMQKQLSRPVEMEEVASRYAVSFADVFNRGMVKMNEECLRDELRVLEDQARESNAGPPPKVPVATVD